MSHDDSFLVLRLKQGDERAFTEIVDKYKGKAFGLAYRFLNNVEDAKEVSQDAFVKVYRSIGRFRERSSFYTWFYRILVNLCIDFRRKRRLMIIPFSQLRKKDDPQGPGPEEWIEDKKSVTPRNALSAKELGRQVAGAIDSLPEKQKIVFTLRNYEGLSLKEIAGSMHCAEGTVKSHLSRAVKNLHDRIKKG